MLELVFKWGPPIVGVMTQLVKAFDDRSTLPERVRRILYKEFLTGQEELDRAKAAEEDIRKVAIEQDEEKIRGLLEYRRLRLEHAMNLFAVAANALKGVERAWSLYYFAICAAKLGYSIPAERELLKAKTESKKLRKDLLAKAPGRIGMLTVMFAISAGVLTSLVWGWWLPGLLVGLIWLFAAAVFNSANPEDAAELVALRELDETIAPDDPKSRWPVPRWALQYASAKS